jgi:hypothetical protein
MRKESLVAWIELERCFQEERTKIKFSCLMYTINDSWLEVESVVDYFYFIFIFEITGHLYPATRRLLIFFLPDSAISGLNFSCRFASRNSRTYYFNVLVSSASICRRQQKGARGSRGGPISITTSGGAARAYGEPSPSCQQQNILTRINAGCYSWLAVVVCCPLCVLRCPSLRAAVPDDTPPECRGWLSFLHRFLISGPMRR